MGASFNTILLPALSRDALLGLIAGFLAEHGAEVERVEHQGRAGQTFATTAARVVLFGPVSEGGWVPVTSWGDGLVPYPRWYTANPLARLLSRSASEAVYLFSFDAGFVAGYSVFAAGEQVESQVVPWREGVSVGPDFALSAPAPNPSSHLGRILGEPAFDYVRFARSFTSVEMATGALVARFAVAAHFMDPLYMIKGRGLALAGGDYRDMPLAGWSCVTYQRTARQDETGAVPDPAGR